MLLSVRKEMTERFGGGGIILYQGEAQAQEDFFEVSLTVQCVDIVSQVGFIKQVL